MIQIFDFTEYKGYLRKALEDRKKVQKGVRTRFADAIQCRSGYVTQILEGSADLSLEQADLASEFLAHTEEEAEYFLLLVIHGRSGTKQLKTKIAKQISKKREQNHDLKNRFKVEAISRESQMIFYSSWQYLAVLSGLSIPGLQSKEALSQNFGIPLKRISEILEFMEQTNLIVFEKGRYRHGTNRTYLGKDSPMVLKHHLNWRVQAMQSIEKQNAEDLHYSSVISLSKKDSRVVKEKLIQTLEEIAKVIEPSPEETVASLCVDYFHLLKT